MNRYPLNNILKEPKGPRYFASTKYPFIVESINDVYIITQQGDRLDNLATQFYGDPTLYWVFQIANELNRDSLYPPIGVQLRIPQDLTKILQDFDKLNP
jgi:nucleoid-associated protein YgaU